MYDTSIPICRLHFLDICIAEFSSRTDNFSHTLVDFEMVLYKSIKVNFLK